MLPRSWTGLLLLAASLAAQADTVPLRRGYLGLQLGHSGTALTCGRPVFACERAWGQPQAPAGYAASVRWQFTDSISATVGVGAYEQPLGWGGHEKVREASVGFQWRY